MATEMSALSLLSALQHGDSAFPSGGFAFSQGLEGLASTTGAKPVEADIAAFVREQIRWRWASADRVALVLAFRAGSDVARRAAVDRDLDRSTFCETLRSGARRNGQALLSTHVRLRTPGAEAYRAAVGEGHAPGTLPVVQALVWGANGLGEAAAVLMSGYQIVAGSLAAAVRLGFVGALGAQGLMAPLIGAVADAAAEPVADDAEIASFTPFSEIAAMRQARLGLRLFAN